MNGCVDGKIVVVNRVIKSRCSSAKLQAVAAAQNCKQLQQFQNCKQSQQFQNCIWVNGEDAGFDNYPLPVFAGQTGSPGNASYLADFNKMDLLLRNALLFAIFAVLILAVFGTVFYLVRKKINVFLIFSENFTSAGRLNRKPYAIMMVIGLLYFIFLAISSDIYVFLNRTLTGPYGVFFDIFAFILGLIFLIITIMGAIFILLQIIRRLHDLDLTGWIALVMLLHFLSFWAFIPTLFEFGLFFIDGTKGPNEYGDDPKGRKPKYENENGNENETENESDLSESDIRESNMNESNLSESNLNESNFEEADSLQYEKTDEQILK
ncbi:hypothetical protein MsAm2_06710 [Methanolapillus ohkumae]|uniref:DUF805 domain-containing protein n=2 Tax=Methanolapillus ohkumae TaxID=3028298 RepID=A0AA96V6R9_9EURY|nr:hypothetical protein MsAm2_06710 [Methanosarcinaceae archaeon Am2]